MSKPRNVEQERKWLAAQASKMDWCEFCLLDDGRKRRSLGKMTRAVFMEVVLHGDFYTGGDVTLGLQHLAKVCGSVASAKRYLERLRRLMLLWTEKDKDGKRKKKWKHGTLLRQASLAFADLPASVRWNLTWYDSPKNEQMRRSDVIPRSDDGMSLTVRSQQPQDHFDEIASLVVDEQAMDAAMELLAGSTAQTQGSTAQIQEVNGSDSQGQRLRFARSTAHIQRSTAHHGEPQPPVVDPPFLNPPPSNHHGRPDGGLDSSKPAGMTEEELLKQFGESFGEYTGWPMSIAKDERPMFGALFAAKDWRLIREAFEKWLRTRQRGFAGLNRVVEAFVNEFDSTVGVLVAYKNAAYVPPSEEVFEAARAEEHQRWLVESDLTEEEFVRIIENGEDEDTVRAERRTKTSA
jgi:hypothetical protein